MNIFQVGYVFARHNDKDFIFKTWIRLDNFSMAGVINNREHAMNVQACDEDNVLDIFTNVGSQRYL